MLGLLLALAMPLRAADAPPAAVTEGLRLLAGSSSGRAVAAALRDVEIVLTDGYTGMDLKANRLYLAREYAAPGASARLAAVILAVAATDLVERAVPPSSVEGVMQSHVQCYRVAVELDIPPAEIGEIFGASIADWIEDPARERRGLLDNAYESIDTDLPAAVTRLEREVRALEAALGRLPMGDPGADAIASALREKRAALREAHDNRDYFAAYDLPAARLRMAEWERETARWRTAQAREMEAWRAAMRAWLAARARRS